jgi:hypothetical protein
MLPYHTAHVLQQERLSRYQGTAVRRSRPGLLDSLSRATRRVVENLNRRTEVRPAI